MTPVWSCSETRASATRRTRALTTFGEEGIADATLIQGELHPYVDDAEPTTHADCSRQEASAFTLPQVIMPLSAGEKLGLMTSRVSRLSPPHPRPRVYARGRGTAKSGGERGWGPAIENADPEPMPLTVGTRLGPYQSSRRLAAAAWAPAAMPSRGRGEIRGEASAKKSGGGGAPPPSKRMLTLSPCRSNRWL